MPTSVHKLGSIEIRTVNFSFSIKACMFKGEQKLKESVLSPQLPSSSALKSHPMLKSAVVFLAAVASAAPFALASHSAQCKVRSSHTSDSFSFSSSRSFSPDAFLTIFSKIAERELDATLSSKHDLLAETLNNAGETSAPLLCQHTPCESLQLRRPFKLSRTVEYS